MASATDCPFGCNSLCSVVGVCLNASDRQTDGQRDWVAHIITAHQWLPLAYLPDNWLDGVTHACTRSLIIHQDCRQESTDRRWCWGQDLAVNTRHPSFSAWALDKVFTADISERRSCTSRLSNERQHDMET